MTVPVDTVLGLVDVVLSRANAARAVSCKCQIDVFHGGKPTVRSRISKTIQLGHEDLGAFFMVQMSNSLFMARPPSFSTF